MRWAAAKMFHPSKTVERQRSRWVSLAISSVSDIHRAPRGNDGRGGFILLPPWHLKRPLIIRPSVLPRPVLIFGRVEGQCSQGVKIPGLPRPFHTARGCSVQSGVIETCRRQHRADGSAREARCTNAVVAQIPSLRKVRLCVIREADGENINSPRTL